MKSTFIALMACLFIITTNHSFAAKDIISDVDQQAVITQPININQATLKELLLLKGVGKKKAQAIIAYRESNGNFLQVNELLNVKGIGKKILKDNQAILTL